MPRGSITALATSMTTPTPTKTSMPNLTANHAPPPQSPVAVRIVDAL